MSLCVHSDGVQQRSIDLDSLVTNTEPRLEPTETVSQRAPAPTLLTCSMGSSVDAWSESKIDTLTYIGGIFRGGGGGGTNFCGLEANHKKYYLRYFKVQSDTIEPTRLDHKTFTMS